MPRRTNEFQQIAYLVKASMATDAVVCESDELTDLVTGQKREVDITVRSNTAGHEVVVSLECRDRSRPASIEWVEQMHAKHATLPTNLLVLVSRNGFTKSAVAKAQLSGIVTAGFDDSPEAVASKLHSELSGLWIHGFSLTSSSIELDVMTSEGVVRSSVEGNVDVFDGDGLRRGTVGALVEAYLSSPGTSEQVSRAHEDLPAFGEGHLSVEPKILYDGHEVTLYVQRAEDMALCRITMLRIGIKVLGSREPLEVFPARMGETELVVGKSRVVDDDLLLVATLADDGRVAFAALSADSTATGHFRDDSGTPSS